ncbi:MAG: glycosyltransferase family 39 protein [Nanoarchaeota archaeon]|nr:glycosyltransferase family 39 protein [Nanoarchaeota archaeon]
MKPSPQYYLPFILVWVYGLLIYPVWLAIPSTYRLITYLGLLIIILIAGKFLYQWTTTFTPTPPKEKKDKYWWALLGIGIIYFFLNLPFLAQDLPPLSDESFHISRGTWLIEPFLNIAQNNDIPFFGITQLILPLTILGLWYFLRKKKQWLQPTTKKVITASLLLIAYYIITNKIAIYYHTIKFGTPILDHLNWLTYYGPISSLFYGLEFTLGGYSEFWMRIIQPLFMLGAALYLYQLLALRLEKKAAFIGGILYLFSPIIMYFAALSYLEAGQLFFITAASYYFIRSRINNHPTDIITSFLFITIGYMYKQPVLFLLPIFAAYLLIEALQKKVYNPLIIIKNYAGYLKGLGLALVGIGPLLIINLLFDIRHSGDLGVFSQWLSPHAWTIYFSLLPRQTNILIFIFFMVGLLLTIYTLRKKTPEQPVLLYLTLWFIIWYLIHMSYIILTYYPVRITVPFIPAVIGISILPLHYLYQHHKKIAHLLAIIIITFTIISTTTLAYHNYHQRYVPIDNMFQYIKEHIPANETILATTAPHPYDFYINKHHITNKFVYDSWQPYDEQTPENLYEYLKENNIHYTLFISPQPNYYDYYPSNHSWIEYEDCAGRKAYQEKKASVTLCPLNANVVQQLEQGKKGFIKDYTNNNTYNSITLYQIAE